MPLNAPAPMVSVTLSPEYRIVVEEPCSLAHERQILSVPLPPALFSGTVGHLRDTASGRLFPIQAVRSVPGVGFLRIEIAPGERLELVPAPSGAMPDAAGAVRVGAAPDGGYIVENDRFALRLSGSGRGAAGGLFSPGPVSGVRHLPGGPWRGRTFFDTRLPVSLWETEVIEAGPLRAVLRYRAWIGSGGVYEAAVTLDAGSDFARIAERWEGNSPGDQIVWDFAGGDLPLDLLRLDSTAGCSREAPLHYFQDRRLCRLFAWTQMSQLSDLSDGCALTFASGGNGEDAIGFVTLEGGAWRGNRLNHLEAWTRRWIGGDPASRRDVPDGAKRDAFPSPERIPACGRSRTTPHLNIEGWIGESGARQWALVAAPAAEMDRGAGISRLRRIHTQHGLLPLAAQAGTVFRWPEPEDAHPSRFAFPDPVIEAHLKWRDRGAPAGETPAEREARRTRQMLADLANRVSEFWEESGCAAANPVSCRDIAPWMLFYEHLAATGRLAQEERAACRARFAFLIRLFASDNYYPGRATMLPADHPDSTEPTLEGMANQNFYTDVINIPGMGAQVFPEHPDAPAWRTRFGEHWARQMEYHVYPESGVWEESHTYGQHVLSTVLPTLLRRRADRIDDGFADPAFQRLVAGMVRQITPRDRRLGGVRTLAPLGDHSAEHQAFVAIYKPLAEGFAPHDARLAGHLSWLYREMDGAEPSEVAPLAPPLTAEAVEGLGYFLRGTDDGGAEFLLALRAGSAWGHHHQDEGSIQFWAKGRSLIVDAGFGEWAAGTRKFSDAGHSRWTLTDFPAMNYLYRFNRGWITAHAEDGPFPYAVAHAPTYLQNPAPRTACPLPSGESAAHRRAVVRIGPCAFLVVDVAESRLAQTVRFHVPEGDSVSVITGGVAIGMGLDCRLTLLSVLPDQAPLAVVGGDPLPNDKATREIAAPIVPVDGRSRAAYLLVADDPAESPGAPSVVPDGADAARVQGHGFAVRVSFSANHFLRLTDTRSGQERTIDLSPPARYAG